jgi:rubredoxin
MGRWKCRICGYVYDPVQGDPETVIPPGTAFEDLPANWACPACGVRKVKFEKM